MGARPDHSPAPDDAEPGWQRDPYERHERRWWDGRRWTERVRDGDLVGIDRPGVHIAPRRAPSHVPTDGIDPPATGVRWKSTRLPAMIAVSVLVLAVVVVLAAVVAVTG